MKYPKCANISCKYNDKYLCKANGIYQEEDIVCRQGKADARKRVK